MRRTTARRPIRLTESKLRQIIRSVIKESLGQKDPRIDKIKRCLQQYDGRIVDAYDLIGEIGYECNGKAGTGNKAHELIWDALSEHGCFSAELTDDRVSGRNFDDFMSIDDGVYFTCPSNETELNELAHKIRAACARQDSRDYM